MAKQNLSTKQWMALINKARAGDPKAFEELCSRKFTSILLLCKNIMRNWQDAEDASQEVFIKMQKDIVTLQAPEAFLSWLNRLVFNTCWNMRQKQMKQPTQPFSEQEDATLQDLSPEGLPSQLLENSESRWQVMEAINSLPENYRTCIFLHYYENLTYQEIAQVLDITPYMVTNYLNRGRAALQKKLSAEGGNFLSFSIVLPIAIAQTEGLIATQRAEKLLERLGLGQPTPKNFQRFWKQASIGTAACLLLAGVFIYGFPTGENTSPFPLANPSPALQNPPSAPASTAQQQPPATPAKSTAEKENIPAHSLSVQSPTGVSSLTGRVSLESPTPSNYAPHWGLAGAEVLLISATDPGRIVQTTKTLGNEHQGWYLFEGVENGDYFVQVILPSGMLLLSYQSGEAATNNTNGAHLENSSTRLDILLYQIGVVSGKVEEVQANQGSKLGDIQVDLLTSDGIPVMQTTTDATGAYVFNQPPLAESGSYTLRFTAPTGSTLGFQSPEITAPLTPGQNTTLPPVLVEENRQPIVLVHLPGTTSRREAFTIEVLHTANPSIQWQLLQANGSPAASGTGTTPGDSLLSLPSGDYLLQVTASNQTGWSAKTEERITLA